MTDNETTADVIAAMRDEAARADMEQECSIDDAASAAKMMREFARRFEAAHKREMRDAVTNCNQFGNAAKLREALKAIGGLCAGLMPTWDGAVGRIKDMAETALAAPPRNCDRFATVDEARKAHEAICEKYDECRHCPLNNEEHYSAFDCFEAWLFAPATVTEGGGK